MSKLSTSVLDINGYTRYNNIASLSFSALTHDGYYGNIDNVKGDYNARYGTTTNQMVDRRADSQTVGRARTNSAVLDTEEEADSLQVWPKAQGQRERFGAIYRGKQNRSGVNLPKSDIEPFFELWRVVRNGP